LLIRIIYLFDFETSWIAKNLDSRRCHEYVCDRFNFFNADQVLNNAKWLGCRHAGNQGAFLVLRTTRVDPGIGSSIFAPYGHFHFAIIEVAWTGLILPVIFPLEGSTSRSLR
jgi:hypothetical protein